MSHWADRTAACSLRQETVFEHNKASGDSLLATENANAANAANAGRLLHY